MEDMIENLARFWFEAMQTFKQVVEKGACEVVDMPACEPGLPQPDVPWSQDEENNDHCK